MAAILGPITSTRSWPLESDPILPTDHFPYAHTVLLIWNCCRHVKIRKSRFHCVNLFCFLHCRKEFRNSRRTQRIRSRSSVGSLRPIRGDHEQWQVSIRYQINTWIAYRFVRLELLVYAGSKPAHPLCWIIDKDLVLVLLIKDIVLNIFKLS